MRGSAIAPVLLEAQLLSSAVSRFWPTPTTAATKLHSGFHRAEFLQVSRKIQLVL